MTVWLYLIFTMTSCLEAKTLSLEEVMKSVNEHYPEILSSKLEIEKAQQTLRQIRGQGFDAKIKGVGDKRYSGYYDGEYGKAQLEKPFPVLNSKVYLGQRISEGEFPDYEGKMDTLSKGEGFLGVAVSLIRNSYIDLIRYDLWTQEESLKQAEFKFNRAKLRVQQAARKAYWTWVVKSWELELYEDILELAKSREKSIKRRVQAGDLAKIFESENSLYINERLANLKQAQMDYQVASFYLSLYYRTNEGEPMSIKKEWTPKHEDALSLKETPAEYVVENQSIQRSLELNILSSQKEQAELDLSLGQNYLLPKLDLKVEWNEDYGQGPDELRGQETRAYLSFEIPLQFNKGLGKKESAQAQLDVLKIQRNFEKDKIKVRSKELVSKIDLAKSILVTTQKQVELSEKLAEAELEKFKQGSSDLLDLNLREDKLANSRVKNLEYFLKYHYYLADLKYLTVEIE